MLKRFSLVVVVVAVVSLALGATVLALKTENEPSGQPSITQPSTEAQVTDDEYRRALEATADCVRAAGFEAAVRPAVGQRPPSITMTAATQEDAAKATAALEQCRAQFSTNVEAAWLQQHASSLSERDMASRALADCMRAAGVTGVGDTVSAEQQREWLGFNGTGNWGPEERLTAEAHLRCLVKVEEQTGIRP
jgi:type IV secretory pathway VirB10-like protein